MKELDIIRLKIIRNGEKCLTIQEKLAFVLGDTNLEISNLSLAQNILFHFGDLDNLSKAKKKDLEKVKELNEREIEIILQTTKLLM